MPISTMEDKLPQTIDELLHWRAKTDPSAPILSYPSSGDKFIEYTAAELDRMTTLAAALYTKTLPEDALTPGSVVGILGVGTLEYIVTYLALQRLRLTCLFLSTRLSEAGLTHLLKTTNCRAILSQYRFHPTISRVRPTLSRPLSSIPMLEGAYILNPIVMDALRPLTHCTSFRHRHTPSAPEPPAWIIHSSGTTGLPKPVPIAASRALASLRAQGAPPRTLSTLPLFHSFGLSGLNAALVHGRVLAVVAPDAPVTGGAVVGALRATRARRLVTVPYVLQLVVAARRWERALAALEAVTFGGAPVPEGLGERLVGAGVRLVNHYGLSECGGRMMRPVGLGGEDWKWLVLMPHAVGHARFEAEEEEGGRVCRLVVGPGLPTRGWVEEQARADGWYDTKDLFERHPADEEKWRFVGRQDDTIVLVNGEKANAVPFELAVKKNKYVKTAVAFGDQRDSMGMIVIPETKGSSSEQVLESIWPEVEAVNEEVPKYARISRDAILIQDPGTTFPSTDKGTVIRSAFYKQFEVDIENHYTGMRLPNGVTSNGVEPRNGDYSFRSSIREVVRESLQLKESDLADDADFFALGMDSLQATRIQARLVKQISSVIPVNAVFQNPSVDLLTRYLESQEENGVEETEEVAAELVEKYSKFPPNKGAKTPHGTEKEVVLLTGATGFLGRYILSSLLQRTTVEKVYCLVRAKDSTSAHSRILTSLETAHILESTIPHLPKLKALPSDLSAPDLGLDPPTRSELLSTITHVIHNAWTVNFTMPLPSFAGPCLSPTHALLALCAATARTPTFTFISSVAAASNTPSPVAEELVPFAQAGATGYAQAKWAAECICAAAAAKAGIPTRVLRVGQVAGDRARGAWNPREAIPMTVRAVGVTGAMPLHAEEERLSWLAVDDCAEAVVEAAMVGSVGGGDGGGEAGCEVLHVCNPRTFSWNEDFLPALRRAGLDFESVEGPEWMRRLEMAERDPEKNPAVKLLDWFRSVYGEDSRKNQVAAHFETQKSQKRAPSLERAAAMGDEMFGKFLRFWQNEAWE